MKKLYSIILLVLSFTQISGQGYYPMLDSTFNSWYYVSNAVPVRMASIAPDCDYINSSFMFSSVNFITSGDTLINGFTYKKLEQTQLLVPGSDCFFGYIREDTATQRIYFMDNLLSPEILLYDFSMQVGDTIEYNFIVPGWYYTSGTFTVDSISTVNILAGPRRIFYLNNHAAFPMQYPMEWIEGVGHPGHVIFTHSGNTSFGNLFLCNDYLIRDFYQSLTCFEHGAQKVFFDSCAHAAAYNNWCFYYADSCNFWNICGSLEENGVLNAFKITPNPSSEPVIIYIESNKTTTAELVLSDISGKVISEKVITIIQGINEIPFDPGALSAGSYLVALKMEEGSSYRQLVRTE